MKMNKSALRAKIRVLEASVVSWVNLCEQKEEQAERLNKELLENIRIVNALKINLDHAQDEAMREHLEARNWQALYLASKEARDHLIEELRKERQKHKLFGIFY